MHRTRIREATAAGSCDTPCASGGRCTMRVSKSKRMCPVRQPLCLRGRRHYLLSQKQCRNNLRALTLVPQGEEAQKSVSLTAPAAEVRQPLCLRGRRHRLYIDLPSESFECDTPCASGGGGTIDRRVQRAPSVGCDTPCASGGGGTTQGIQLLTVSTLCDTPCASGG